MQVSEEAEDPVDWGRHSRQAQARSGKVEVVGDGLSLKSTWIESPGVLDYRYRHGAVMVQSGLGE